MKQYDVKSPTRVDLAGGTLDLWPLYTFIDKALTVNVAIDIFTYATLRVRNDSKIVLNIMDMEYKKEYDDLSACLADEDPKITLLQTHVHFWKPKFGFELETKSDSPIGGGLGGSSSLSISLIKVFSKAMDKKLSEEQMVWLAHNLEARVLRTPTGTQDYYPPISGGLNVLYYGYAGVKREPLEFDDEAFRKHFLLAYTGKPHHSGLNNWQVLQDAIGGKPETLSILTDLKQVAVETADTCRQKNWGGLPPLFDKEYELRVKLAYTFASLEISKLREVAMKAGAYAVKICGAGGGGCVLIWCPQSKRNDVLNACEESDFLILPAQPTTEAPEVSISEV